MHFQRMSIIIAAAAGMLGTFLPWVNIPILGSYNGTRGDGWITFVLFALIVFLAIVGNRQHVLKGLHFFITMLFSVAAGGFGLWKIIDFQTSIGSSASDNALTRAVGSAVSVGFGLYLIVIAGLAVLILGSAIRKE